MLRLFINFFAVIGLFNTVTLLIYFASKHIKFKKKANDNNVQSNQQEQTSQVEKND